MKIVIDYVERDYPSFHQQGKSFEERYPLIEREFFGLPRISLEFGNAF